MKGLFASLLLFCAISSISAEPPQNLRATAISDDGFTLRWDAMDAVDEYDVEVIRLNELKTSFEPGDEEIVLVEKSGKSTGVFENGSYSNTGTHYLRVYGTDDSATLSGYNGLIQLSFYARSRLQEPWFELQCGFIGENDADLGSEIFEAKGWLDSHIHETYGQQMDASPESHNVKYVKFSFLNRTRGTACIDDVSYLVLDPADDSGDQDTTLHQLYRFGQLLPETKYACRVRISSQDSSFSPWLIVSTLADDPAYGAGTAFAGYPAQIDLTAADIPQSISIFPSAVSEADYQVQLSGEGNSFTYTISIDDANALAGIYTIHHPGHRSQNTSVAGAENPQIATDSGTTTITISTPNRSAELFISLDLDVDTLPVELSYFQAQSISARSCRLDWRTESESNLLGYRVLRGTDASPDLAELLSPLIPAQNSSQPRSYSFLDNSPDYPAYYYLMSLGLDGIEQISEPIFVDFQNPEQQLMDPNQNGFSIYPNPFNQKAILQLSLAWEQEIGLKLYDAKGRLLRSEALGRYPAGAHQIPFMATDNRGSSLASGAYLIEVTFQNESLLGKIMLSK